MSPGILLLVAAGALLAPGAPLPAQDLRSERLSVEDGLAHTTVWNVHQDRLGFMWIATEAALQRYDGHNFKSYKNDPDDPGSLSANEVLRIHEDRRGALWFGTRGGGLDRYDRAQERFVHYRHDPADPESLSADTIWALHADSSGALWVGTTTGLDRLDDDKGTFTRYRHDPADPASLSPGWVNAILEDRRGDLWIGTAGGLNRKTRRAETFVHYGHDPADPHSLSDNVVWAIYEDHGGTLWIGTNVGLDRFDRPNDRFVRFRFDDGSTNLAADYVTAIREDRAGELWIARFGAGLSRLAAAGAAGGRRLVHYRHDDRDSGGLSSEKLLDLHVDRSGLLWIASKEGLDVADRRRERFSVYRQGPRGMAGHLVNTVTEDRAGVLWVGTADGGLTGFDRARGTAVHYRSGADSPVNLPDDTVQAVLEDRFGELWIGTAAAGVVRLDRDRRLLATYQPDPGDPGSLTHVYVRQLLEDRQGRLWVGGIKPLQRFVRSPRRGANGMLPERREQEHFITPGTDPSEPGEAGFVGIFDLYEDRSGELWVGTTEGLERLDEEADTFVRYLHDPEDRNSLSSNVIHAVYQDAAEVFWLGTDAGLNRWDRARGEFRHFRERDGLPSDKVVGVLDDEAGRLWLSTAAGLSRFDPRAGTFRNYDTADGLHGTVFYTGATHRSGRGELFFGGPRGLTSFFPDRITDDPTPPAVVLTQLRLSGEPVRPERLDPGSPLSRAITDTRELVLDHRQKVFSLEFAALHFASPRKNRYAYRLQGFDETWSSTHASRPVARYTNLDAGHYVFRVKASNPDGAWNEEGASIEITVLPPPWQSWWAYSLYALALAAMVLGYVRSHRKEIRRERQAAERERAVSRRLREVGKLKDEFLANTSHELRTPLYGIVGLADSLLDGAEGPLPEGPRRQLSMIASSGRRLGHLVGEILDFSKLRRRSLELVTRPVDLRAMADVVLTLSEPLVGSKCLELENAVPRELPPAEADENRLQQILLNLVGNAVKFTESGRVQVSAAGEAEELVISVADTGIGIPAAQRERIFNAFEQADASIEREYGGTGLGLAVTRQLVELHGGRIWVDSTPGEGSSFNFSLPIAAGTPQAGPSQARPPQAEKTAAVVQAPMAARSTAVAPRTFVSSRAEPPAEMPPAEGPSEGGPEEAQAPAAGARILAVDDEPVNREVLRSYLAHRGYELALASSGEEALRLLRAQPFDLVLLDIMMPRMSGYEVCRILRQEHPIGELPVIFLTAKNQASDVITGLSLGANDYLAKPISKGELVARVRPHLELVHVHRNLEDLVEEKVAQIKVLRGLLPICTACKKIRDDEGYWSELELFIDSHSEARFTHGICPDCARQYLEQLDGSTEAP